jgi:hypothetical protein
MRSNEDDHTRFEKSSNLQGASEVTITLSQAESRARQAFRVAGFL